MNRRQSTTSRTRGSAKGIVIATLPKDAILTSLNSLGVGLTAPEMAKPNYAVVKQVFETLVDIFCGVEAEHLNQPRFTGLDCLTHAELHDDSIPRLELFRATKKMLADCEYTSFSLTDLLKPTPDRFLDQLSHMMNFGVFREDHLDLYEDLAEGLGEAMKEEEDITGRIAEAKRRLQDLRESHKSRQPELERLEEEEASLREEVDSLNKNQARLKYSTAEAKKASKLCKDEMRELRFKLLSAKEEVAKLERQIVPSPERLKQEIGVLETRMDEAKAAATAGEKQARDIQGRVAIATQATEAVAAAIELLGAAEAEAARTATAETEAVRVKYQAEEVRASMLELDNRETHTSNRLQRMAERKRQAALDFQRKEAAAERAVAAAKAELEVLRREHAAERGEAARLSSEYELRKREMAEEIMEEQDRVQEVIGSFKTLQTAAREYHTGLIEAMQSNSSG